MQRKQYESASQSAKYVNTAAGRTYARINELTPGETERIARVVGTPPAYGNPTINSDHVAAVSPDEAKVTTGSKV